MCLQCVCHANPSYGKFEGFFSEATFDSGSYFTPVSSCDRFFKVFVTRTQIAVANDQNCFLPFLPKVLFFCSTKRDLNEGIVD